LIKHGAEINTILKDNDTAAHAAFRYNNQIIIKLILECHPNMDIINNQNKLPIHCASDEVKKSIGLTEYLRTLLTKKTPSQLKKKQARQKKNEFLKVFERPVNRKIGTDIDEQESVKIVVNFLQSNATEIKFTEEKDRLELIHHYVMFRQMLEQIDKNEDESGDDKEEKVKIEPVPDEKIISSLKIDKSVKKKVQKMNKKRKRKVSSSDDDPPSEDDLLDYIVDE